MIESDIRWRAQEKRGAHDASDLDGNHETYSARREPQWSEGRSVDRATAGHTVDDRYEDEQDDPDNPYWTFDEEQGVWVDPYGKPYVEEYAPGEEERYAPAEDDYLASHKNASLPKSRSRFGMGSAAAGVLIVCLLGGVGYAWKKGGFVGSSVPGLGSAPPVIKADTGPVKIKPVQTTSVETPPIQEIFVKNGQAAPPQNERLVSGEEQPLANVPVQAESTPQPSGERPLSGERPPSSERPHDTTDARPVSTSTITLPPPASSEILPTPEPPQGTRKVTTITIVPGNSSPQAETVNPGDAVSLPDNTDMAGNMAGMDDNAPAHTGAANAAGEAADMAGAGNQAGSAVPAGTDRSSVVIPADPDVVSGEQTATEPGGSAPQQSTTSPPVRPAQVNTQDNRQAKTQVVAVAPPQTSSQAGAAAGYVVQVSSQRSQAEAQAAFNALQRKNPAMFAKLKPSIKKVDLGERGIYYRLRVGLWNSNADAAAFCSRLKEEGADCVIARY